MLKVGVLGLQGSVQEHCRSLSMVDGVQPYVVNTKYDLDKIRGIILPGGESTTIGKLMKDFDIEDRLREKIKEGMPVWGTCAGMILMARRIVNQDRTYLGVMDITVRRNAYGGQLNSFRTEELISEVSSNKVPLVFIRAPRIENAAKDVLVLARVNNNVVAAKSNNMLVTSFHPELTSDLSFHKYFVDMINSL